MPLLLLLTKKNESNMTILTSSQAFTKIKVAKAESNILSEFYREEIL